MTPRHAEELLSLLKLKSLRLEELHERARLWAARGRATSSSSFSSVRAA